MALKGKKAELKFVSAHAAQEGYACDIVYHPSGDSFVTVGGNDSYIRVWNKKKSDSGITWEAQQFTRHEEAINGIAFNKTGDKLATCSDDHEVQIQSFPGINMEKQLTKFELGAKCVAWNVASTWVAAGSESSHIKVIFVLDNKQCVVLKAHDGAVRSVAFDPKDSFLASAGTDGNVKLFSIEQNYKEVNSLPIIPRSQITDNKFCKIAWHPNGQYLAVPCDKEIKLVERDSWKIAYSLKEAHNKEVNVVAFSPNGRYLATSGLDLQVMIWDLSSKETIHRCKTENIISGLAWNPKSNTLAMIDVVGRYALWENIIPKEFPKPHELTGELKTVTTNLDEELFGDEIKEEKKQKEIAKTDADLDDVDDLFESKASRDPLDVIDGDDLSDPEREEMKSSRKLDISSKAEFLFGQNRKKVSTQQYYGGDVPPQPSFQSCSSERDKSKRYLSFNEIGFIVLRDEHSQNSLEVEFHDTARHRPIKLVDRNSVSMGALGNNGFAFASNIQKEMPSVILYRGIDNSYNWTYTLPVGEDTDAIAVCDKHVAVATNKEQIRIFRHSGAQVALQSVAGPVVSMIGHKDLLGVVYHGAPTFCGSQRLKYFIWDISKEEILIEGDAPISPQSVLTWIGFSPSGFFTTMDSKGVLRMNISKTKGWIPVLELESLQKSERYWIFGVTDSQARFLPLREGELSPPTTARPTPQLFPLRIPLIVSDSYSLEEQYLREGSMLAAKYGKTSKKSDSTEVIRGKATLDTILMKLIEAAMKGNKLEKALDLCWLITFQKPLVRVIALAQELNLRNLAEQMQMVMKTRFETEASDSDSSDEEEEEEEQKPAKKMKKEKEPEPQQKPETKENSKSPIKTKDSSSSLRNSNSNAASSSIDYSDADSLDVSKDTVEKENSSQNSNSQPLHDSNSNSEKSRKKNRFAKDKPIKSDSIGLSLFESLSKNQKAANETDGKKRKLNQLFK